MESLILSFPMSHGNRSPYDRDKKIQDQKQTKSSIIFNNFYFFFFYKGHLSLTALCTWFMMNIKLEFKYYKILNWICSCKTTVPYSAGLITTFTIDILKYLHKKISDKHNLKSKQLRFETNFVCFCKTIPTDNFLK